MTVILAVSTRSYLWPGGASRSARAITSSASSSSSRPCRSSSASQSVQNPGPDAIRAAIPAAPESSPRGAGGVDACVMTMANLAGNKAPGERKGRRQPRSYQELCSISGTIGSRHAAATNTQPDRDQPSEKQTPQSISQETLGQWAGPGYPGDGMNGRRIPGEPGEYGVMTHVARHIGIAMNSDNQIAA